MLRVQFDEDVLRVQPDGPITREDVATLARTADEYLASHAKIAGAMLETRTFPSFASAGAFVDYARFIVQHRARVRRVALVTNSALGPVAKFMANRIVGVEMQHFSVCPGYGSTGVAQVALRSSERFEAICAK